jgi:hypothetical protein
MIFVILNVASMSACSLEQGDAYFGALPITAINYFGLLVVPF